MMLAAFLAVPILLLAIGAAVLKDVWIDTLGIGRKLELINNGNCLKIPGESELAASQVKVDRGVRGSGSSNGVS